MTRSPADIQAERDAYEAARRQAAHELGLRYRAEDRPLRVLGGAVGLALLALVACLEWLRGGR